MNSRFSKINKPPYINKRDLKTVGCFIEHYKRLFNEHPHYGDKSGQIYGAFIHAYVPIKRTIKLARDVHSHSPISAVELMVDFSDGFMAPFEWSIYPEIQCERTSMEEGGAFGKIPFKNEWFGLEVLLDNKDDIYNYCYNLEGFFIVNDDIQIGGHIPYVTLTKDLTYGRR